MISRIARFITLFAAALLVMVAGHEVFMLCLPEIYSGISGTDRWAVTVAGMKMDLAIAGYITLFPGLLIIFSLWLLPRAVDNLMRIYYLIVSGVVAAVMVIDTILYSYWGIKLDTTPFFYFFSSPSLALASVSAGKIILGIIAWLAAWAVIMLAFIGAIKLAPLSDPIKIKRRLVPALVLIVLFINLMAPIRGGFTVATTNLSSAYFSGDMRLNHAAVNPLFSLLYSATHRSGFDSRMQFIDAAEAERIAVPLMAPASYESTAADSLLTTSRPDIYLIILESFSSKLLPVQGGEAIALRLDSIARTGLLFNEFYASSFRTDRAIPAILSGLPAAPDEPVMKHTALAEHLPGLPAEFGRAGYRSTYYYGGDINFTNQRAYLRSAGIDSIVSDIDFPLTERLSKWGVADDNLFRRVLASPTAGSESEPTLTIVQTSSSHEPFDVGSFARYADPAANAFAFADSCLGDFIDSLAIRPDWERTLVVIVPDHYGCYPTGLDERSRHHIPMVMTGGALRTRGIVDTPAAQNDLAATLLAALGLPSGEFPFSRDILATPAPALALFSEPDFAAAISADGSMSRLALTGSDSAAADSASRAIQAYLQTLYTYLSSISSPDLSK